MSDAVEQVHQALTSGDRPPSRNTQLFLRILTPLTWLLLLVTTVYYTFHAPHEGHHPRRRIWKQNSAHHTPFALNSIIVSLYWLALFVLQAVYLLRLFRPASAVPQAMRVAAPLCTHNLLVFGFVHLWVRSHFNWALLLAIVDFITLTSAYSAVPDTPKLEHVATLAAPLAWSFVALFWDGAVAVGARHMASRIVANVFVWSWALWGGFYLAVYKDWAVGLSLSILTAALGVAQFLTVLIALQWIFAFTIMALLFVGTVAIAFPEATGRFRSKVDDRERAPLLANEDA